MVRVLAKEFIRQSLPDQIRRYVSQPVSHGGKKLYSRGITSTRHILNRQTQAPYPQVVLFGDSLFEGCVDAQDGFSFYATLQKRMCSRCSVQEPSQTLGC